MSKTKRFLELVMITIEAHELETHFDELLKKVEHGETVTITRHGVPVARSAIP